MIFRYHPLVTAEIYRLIKKGFICLKYAIKVVARFSLFALKRDRRWVNFLKLGSRP